jgi:hypothetical protein
LPISCVAVGAYSDSSGSSHALIETEYSRGLPSVVVTSSRDPLIAGDTVTYTTTVSPTPDGGTVGFVDNGHAIPACTARPVNIVTGLARCTTSETTPGSHQIVVAYTGTENFAPARSSLTETVQPPPPCPTGITHLASGEPWAMAAMATTVEHRLCDGYWIVTRSGGVTSIGAAPWNGDLSSHALNAPTIGIAATPDHGGYYLLGADGGIFTFGDAAFHGSTGNAHLAAPIVGMAVSPDGGGYWLAGADGGIFTFGDATFHGSTGATKLNQPVVSMSADSHTGGYWLAAADGGIFAFDAPFYGSTGTIRLSEPVVGMSPQPNGHGYRLVARDGGVFDFGNAAFYGSLPSRGVQHPDITTMATSVDGNGYSLINAAGTIWAFGDAPNLGNT